jgi:hypothetical protein
MACLKVLRHQYGSRNNSLCIYEYGKSKLILIWKDVVFATYLSR